MNNTVLDVFAQAPAAFNQAIASQLGGMLARPELVLVSLSFALLYWKASFFADKIRWIAAFGAILFGAMAVGVI